jgi:AraC-like DNA-binding protein
LRKTTIAATQLKCAVPRHAPTKSLPLEDAFLVSLQISGYPAHEFWLDGKALKVGPYAPGDTVIFDVKDDPIARIDHPFHSVFFYLPRSALDMIADGADAPRIQSLRCLPKNGLNDPVVHHLTSALLPAFDKPEQASTLFVDYLTLALAAHVAHVYGDMRPAKQARGGLAPWQERRVKELMVANLEGVISLSQLANECGLSLSYFTRAFRTSTGVPPHRWLMQRRIDKAKDLLRSSDLSLNEIALACGFADQSHFTAVFTRMVGVSPGFWRRARQS